MLALTIYRGCKEIGGTCIELRSENSRILIDYGLPLVDENNESFDVRKRVKGKSKEELIKSGVMHDIKGLYKDDVPSFDAVLLSHPHPDHYGLLGWVNQKIPIYMSQGCKILVGISHLLGRFDCNLENVRVIRPWEEFTVKDFKITPHLVDHSGFAALAYLIECEGKRLLYSGDFRGHGRKKILFENMIKDSSLKDLDYLFLEGTTLGREGKELDTEEDVEKELAKTFRQNKKLIFLACSSQDIDRIVSAYKACKDTGKTLVTDLYTAKILNELKQVSEHIPQYDWGKVIKIFFVPNDDTKKILSDKQNLKFGKAKITWQQIIKEKTNIVLKTNWTIKQVFLHKKQIPDSIFISSQWHGYLEKELNFWKKNKAKIIELHTSGHAYKEELQKFAEALNPKKIIPIHTPCPEDYKKTFKQEILLVKDGETIEI